MVRLKLVKEFPPKKSPYTGDMKKDLLTLFKGDGTVWFRDDPTNDEYTRKKFEKNDYIIAYVTSNFILSYYEDYYGSDEWAVFSTKYNLRFMWATYDLAGIYIDDDDDDEDEDDE